MKDTNLCIKYTILERCLQYLMIIPRRIVFAKVNFVRCVVVKLPVCVSLLWSEKRHILECLFYLSATILISYVVFAREFQLSPVASHL